MPIKLNFVSANLFCYTINFKNKNYTVLVNKKEEVKIQQPTTNYKQAESITNAVLSHHQNYVLS